MPLKTWKWHRPYIEDPLKHYSAVVSVFFSIPLANILAYANSFSISPGKRGIEPAFISRIDSHRSRIAKCLCQLFVGVIPNELEVRCGLHFVRKHNENAHVRGTGYLLGIMQEVVNG